MGDLFTLSPETVNKLNLDSEDRISTELTRINHRRLWQTQMGRAGHREGEGFRSLEANFESWKSREQG